MVNKLLIRRPGMGSAGYGDPIAGLPEFKPVMTEVK
jgi:hypothetical protein